MAIVTSGQWVRTRDGNWVNTDHVDLFEVTKSDSKNEWKIVAWNALQPQVEAYVVATFDTDVKAHNELDALIAKFSR